MRHISLKSVVYSLILTSMTVVSVLAGNCDNFPPADAAKAAMDFDGQGSMINGKLVFLTSGSVHYARVPRELWRDSSLFNYTFVPYSITILRWKLK